MCVIVFVIVFVMSWIVVFDGVRVIVVASVFHIVCAMLFVMIGCVRVMRFAALCVAAADMRIIS